MAEEPTASHKQFQGEPGAGAPQAQGNLTIGGSKAAEKAGTNISWLRQTHRQPGPAFSWMRDLGPHRHRHFFTGRSLSACMQRGLVVQLQEAGCLTTCLAQVLQEGNREMFLSEIRITGSPPRQQFFTLTGVGSEIHLVFFLTKGILLYVI